MDLMCLFVGMVFLLFGAGLFLQMVHPKMDFWKKMTEEERQKAPIRPLTKNVGSMFMVCGMLTALAGGVEVFRTNGYIWAMILWFVACVADVIFIAKSPKYKPLDEVPAAK